MKLNVLVLFEDLTLAVPFAQQNTNSYTIISYVCIICPWQVFQRRVDNTVGFNLDWKSYKEGFGDPSRNFWLGGSTQLTLHSNSQAL